MLFNLLIYRLLLCNVFALAVIGWAWQAGYLGYLKHDTSGISLVILAIFAFGMAVVFQRSFKVSRRLNAVKRGDSAGVNRVKLLQKNSLIDFVERSCVTLGFFGTVVGIITMLFGGGGVSTDGSADSVKQLLTEMLSGAGIAFITTAVGLVCALWLDFHAQMLRTATVNLAEDASGG